MPKKLKTKKSAKPSTKKAKVVKKVAKKSVKKPAKKAVKRTVKSVSAPTQSLEQLFDSFFASQAPKVETKKQSISLDDLFDELFSESDVKDFGKEIEDVYKDVEPSPKKVLTLDELFADIPSSENNIYTEELKKAESKTTSIFTSVVTPKTIEEDLAEIELSALNSGKMVMRKVFGIFGVTLAALVIGILWLQVTYGYFTELDNVSHGDPAINAIFEKNSENYNTIKSDIEKTYNSAVEEYQKLKNK